MCSGSWERSRHLISMGRLRNMNNEKFGLREGSIIKNMSSNLSEPRVPLTHQVPGPSYGVLMDKSLVEVSEGGGYFLAEILDVNNTDLFLRFENPRFS